MAAGSMPALRRHRRCQYEGLRRMLRIFTIQLWKGSRKITSFMTPGTRQKLSQPPQGTPLGEDLGLPAHAGPCKNRSSQQGLGVPRERRCYMSGKAATFNLPKINKPSSLSSKALKHTHTHKSTGIQVQFRNFITIYHLIHLKVILFVFSSNLSADERIFAFS